MSFFRKLKKGFTLVELVVVIAVIAILAAVSVGAYFGITDSANNSKLEQETKQLHTAIQTISLGTHDNQSLSSDGLRVKNLNQFKADLKFATGEDYEVLTGSPTTISRKTVVLSNNTALLQSSGLYTTYTTFEYFTPEVSGKRIVADVVDGTTKIHKYNFTYDKNAEPVEYTRIYWKNPTKFSEDNTYVHTVHDDGSNNGWPGEKMTVYIATEDIYTAEIQTNATKIVFHVGTDEGREEGDNRNQWSVDIDENGIPTDTPYYDNENWGEVPVKLVNVSTKGKTMYFNSIINNRPGFKVYAYDKDAVPNSKYPGDSMTKVAGRNDYMHSYEFPEDYYSIIITNGDNTNPDAHKYNGSVNDGVISLEGFSDVTPYYDGSNWVELPAVPGTTVAEPVVTERKIYYGTALNKWDNMNIYAWNASDEKNGKWPGVAISKYNDSKYVYEATIKDYYTNFLFNTLGDDGNTSAQTSDYTIDNSYSPDTPYWTGTEWTAIPTDTELEAQVPTKLYFKVNEIWKSDNAWFAAYFFGAGDTWRKLDLVENEANIYTIEAPVGYTNVIFCRMNSASNDLSWDNKWNQTGDLDIPSYGSTSTCFELQKDSWSEGRWINKDAEHKHDFVSHEETCLYCETENADYVEPAKKQIYLIPNSNWKQDNARFTAYFFGNGDTWVSMTDEDGDGTYECTVPEGYTSVIFCRMNPNGNQTDWSGKWNQTGDLTVPTDGNNCYTVKENTWDKGGGTWSTYTPE